MDHPPTPRCRTQPGRRRRPPGALLPALLLLAVAAGAPGAAAQSHPPNGTPSPPAPLTVTTNLPAPGTAVPRDASLELTLSRPLVRPAERVAVFIGRTDVTALFRGDARRIAYERGVILLPRGRHELVVYLVEAGSGVWTEVARHPFQTLGPLGFQPGKADPALTAAWGRRVADGYEPSTNAPGELVENVDLQFRLTTEHLREGLKVSSQVALVGASRLEKALRFRDLQEEAPRVDLSSYLLQGASEAVELSVGHVSVGDQRHLVNRFSSRGAALTLRPSPRAQLSVAALNGSGEVGWDNLVGLDDGGHRLVTGSLGLEAFSTPGTLRLEVTGMQGAMRPRAGLNRGAVNDSEESRGVAFRFMASALDRRLRVDGGYTSSTFDNPDDPSLAQGLDLVPVEEETSGARYLETSLDAIRNLRLGATRSARLTVGYRHERVDPLFRSLGAYTQGDRLQDQFDARADVGGVSVQAGWGDARNNLADIPSILTTRTARSQVQVGVPLARVLGRTTAWLPSLQYRGERTHQYGVGIPVNGGFSATHVPDQVSLNRTTQADWQFRRVGLSYSWNRSHQDNRQPGRERADLTVTRNVGTVRLNPHTRVNLSLELGLEASENLERDEADETARWGVQVQWQPMDRSSLSLRLSDTSTEDLAVTRRRTQNQVDAQWSSMLPYLSRAQGHYFLRFTRSRSGAFSALANQDDRRSAWWVDSGVNFTFF